MVLFKFLAAASSSISPVFRLCVCVCVCLCVRFVFLWDIFSESKLYLRKYFCGTFFPKVSFTSEIFGQYFCGTFFQKVTHTQTHRQTELKISEVRKILTSEIFGQYFCGTFFQNVTHTQTDTQTELSNES